MKEKWDKYWGSPKKLNLILFITITLNQDSRFKFVYMELALAEKDFQETTKIVVKKVKEGSS